MVSITETQLKTIIREEYLKAIFARNLITEEQYISRRNFLRKLGAGLAGAAAMSIIDPLKTKAAIAHVGEKKDEDVYLDHIVRVDKRKYIGIHWPGYRGDVWQFETKSCDFDITEYQEADITPKGVNDDVTSITLRSPKGHVACKLVPGSLKYLQDDWPKGAPFYKWKPKG